MRPGGWRLCGRQGWLPVREIVVDNFAGGGGASVGIELAGLPVDEACNHDLAAIAMHAANHPHTRHHTASLNTIDPLTVVQGRPVGLMWCSPDCTHHSKALGGAPRSKRVRDLAWVVVHWAERVSPRVIILENVEEFQSWGPLLDDGKPCPESRGFEFRRWIKALRNLGYRVEWKELRACDYGTPTSRKRLFVIARRDREPIVWPEPTHGPGLLPYRTAAEIIDWTVPVRSIFGRKKPLAPATLRRIARGVQRYVLDAAKPFVVAYYGGPERVHDIDDPLRTQTTENRFALISPHLMVNNENNVGKPLDAPVPTVTTGRRNFLVSPFFVPRYGERPTQEPRCQGPEVPISTVVPTGNGASLVAAFMAQHNTGVVGHAVEVPVSTICATGSHQSLVTSNLVHFRNNCDGRSVEDPIPPITSGGGHVGEVRAFLSAYYGTDQAPDLDSPLPTATTHDRFGVVTVCIEGVEYVLVDIGMRMLEPRELFRAQGFPDSYRIDPEFRGKPLTRTAQVKCCGNSVCPPLAEALVRANVVLREGRKEPARVWAPLFEAAL